MYNCFGNSIGKVTCTLPGYKPGMNSKEVFQLVCNVVGEKNLTHTSILDTINQDEYMVARMIGPDDYHFIVFDNQIYIINKALLIWWMVVQLIVSFPKNGFLTFILQSN